MAASEDTRQDERNGVPKAENLTPPKTAYFPLGYKEAFSQWWTALSPAQTEQNVLSFVPYIQQPESATKSAPKHVAASQTNSTTNLSSKNESDPYGPREWSSNLVSLSGKDRALNELSISRPGEEVENDLVMLHGYGAGLGFFYKNFEALSRPAGWRLFALDLLGMGRSSRPPFKIHAKDHQGKINEAENWFIDALEEWREKKKIEKFTLLGHSLGGYMAVAYALKYPNRLKKLILVSPVGIPEDPNAVNAALPEPDSSTVQNEVLQDSSKIANNKKPDDPPRRRQMPKWFTYLWDANVSPFSLVRLSGPLGPSLISAWTTRRFAHLPQAEADALHDYSYSLFRQRGSGEYVLAYVLAPGAFARSPLIRRIQGVGRQAIEKHDVPLPDGVESAAAAPKRENGVPVVFMYGDHDWMDQKAGRAAAKKIQDEREKALAGKSAEERRADNGSAKVVEIKNAGHHLYLDGYDQFNEIMLEELKDVSRRG